MEVTENKTENTVVNNAAPAAATSATAGATEKKTFPPRNRGDFKTNKKRNPRAGKERVKSEFDQKMISVRRVTRVSSGGRRFTFSAAVIIGNKKGKVGVGIGKAGDTSVAIDKAVKNGKKNILDVKRTPSNSIRHDVKTKYSSAIVSIMPAKGRGLIAGSAVRDVLVLAGLTDVNAKILSGSKNKLNIARATVQALSLLKK